MDALLDARIEVAARVEPSILRPGEAGRLVVEVLLPEGYHIESHEPPEPFLVPTELVLDPVPGFVVGPIVYPPDEEVAFDWSPVRLHAYRGTVELSAPVMVGARGADAGRRVLTGTVRYQVCVGGACLPPTVREIETVLEIAP